MPVPWYDTNEHSTSCTVSLSQIPVNFSAPMAWELKPIQPYYNQHHFIRPKSLQRFSVKFSGMSNLGWLLTQGVNRGCPEEMVELNRLVKSPVVELPGVQILLRVPVYITVQPFEFPTINDVIDTTSVEP